MNSSIPVVETERLILRGRKPVDFIPFAAMWADPKVVQFIGKPLSREEAWTKFARMEGFWALTGYGFWALEEKSTGRFIGETGVADFKREILPTLDGKPEFGWTLISEAQGKGYASEALGAAIDWAKQTLTAKTYCCIIDEANAASIRVAEKAGFARAATADYKGAPVIVFERPRV